MAADECRIVVEATEKEEEIQQVDIENRTITDVTDGQLLLALRSGKKKDHKNISSITKIQRAPEIMLRNEDFKVYYKPMELSFGPIHASDPNLFKMELKVRLAAKFIKKSGRGEEILLNIIQENIQDLRKSFNEEVINSYSDEGLARILYLDGCAILQFIDSFMQKSLNKVGINNGQANLIRQDLFLLENQIPFQVLKLIMKPESHPPFPLFVFMNNVLSTADTEHDLLMSDLDSLYDVYYNSNPVHLLDLLRLILSINVKKGESVYENICINCLEYSRCCLCPIIRLMSLLNSNMVSMLCLSSGYFKLHTEYSFRNVQELKASGITLKTSDTYSLRSISFHTHLFFRSHLKLPTLVVDESTTRKLLNLLTYEMCCPDYEANSVVASYVNLLDLLIDNEDDVKDLRAAGIIRNRLSSDIEVAKLFNSLGSICLVPPEDIYMDVKSKIENHYKRKFVIWRAQVCNVHFSSPWTILALLAAITVLVLTAI